MTLEEIMEIVREEDFDVTLSGGDPLFNPESTRILIHALKNDGRNVWVYTGFTIEEIEADATLSEAVSEADAIVEGPFIAALRDPDLLFRGSSNQRIIKKNF
jgi:anaerobic ribonucleoside-triphosphate reductase activating protein